ncbi:MAG: DUF3618 domain-containing protein [Ktedonobacterales bacterium]|nr:DUF3618 domain-containing protein [Ktedonobacterales bacterium]
MDERTDDLGTYAEYRETSIIQPVSDLTPLDDREAANELTAADEEPQRPEDVIEEIEQTRAEMTGTIDAIQERLSPQRLKQQAQDAIHDATIGRVEQVVSNVQDSARGAGNTILGTIRANPLPAALVGAGLGWLFIKGRQNAQAQSATMTHWPLGAPMRVAIRVAIRAMARRMLATPTSGAVSRVTRSAMA